MRRQTQDDLSQQMNDKLSELWVEAAQKRRQLVRSKMPQYSRIADSSSGLAEKQLVNIRQQLQQEGSSSKHKDLEINNLKQLVSRLANDKKYLIKQLEKSRNITNQNYPHLLNQSSIGNISHKQYQSSIKKLRNKSEHKQKPSANKEKKGPSNQKQRLLQLLRSTSQYRSYVFYYDSHELSYLKRIQEQHKKNCKQSQSEREKNYWAPQELVDKIKMVNKGYNLGLTTFLEQNLISKMKKFYQHNMQIKLRRLRNSYEEKLKETIRQGQNQIPYELVQICRARQRQVERHVRKRTNTSLR